MNLADLSTLVWPLVVLLLALFVLRKIGDDVRPVASAVVSGLAKNAQQHALGYAMAALYALTASLQALQEVATAHHWEILAAFAKIVQPAAVAVIAYVTKPPAFTQALPDSSTNQPTKATTP